MMLLWGQTLVAGGFQTSLLGIKQAGMGHTGVANPLDATSIYFNPGALSLTPKNGIHIGANVLIPKVQFREEGTNKVYEMGGGTTFPFGGYWSWNAKPGQPWRIGLGVYNPFSFSADWGQSWAGRHLMIASSFNAFNIQPTFSYNIKDRVGIGAGFVYSRANWSLRQALPYMLPSGLDAEARYGNAFGGYGFNAGVLVKVTEKLNMGVSYKSGVKYKDDKGKIGFTVPGALVDSFPEAVASTTFQVPWSMDFGVTYQPAPKLGVSLDVNYTNWKNSYIFETFLRHNSSILSHFEPNLSQSALSLSYNNAIAIRLGGSFDIDSNFTLRAGTFLDLTPVKNGFVSPAVPDSDKFGITFGGTMRTGDRFELDVAFTYQEGVRMKENPSENFANLGGTYKGRSIAIGLGLNFNLGKKAKPTLPETETPPQP